MDLETLQKGYPNIGPKALYEPFPRIPVMDYPDLSEYSWEACHRGSLGSGVLFLASEMAQKLELAAGMRVLDLGCGHASSNLFLARHYGVSVVAADSTLSPTQNWQCVQQAGLEGRVVGKPFYQDGDCASSFLPGAPQRARVLAGYGPLDPRRFSKSRGGLS